MMFQTVKVEKTCSQTGVLITHLKCCVMTSLTTQGVSSPKSLNKQIMYSLTLDNQCYSLLYYKAPIKGMARIFTKVFAYS